jgi:hypothetical protein
MSFKESDVVKDRRAAGRIAVNMEIVVSRPGNYFGRWRTTNLSLHGAGLNMSPRDLPVDLPVSTTLWPDEDGAEPIRLEGRVVRASEDGVAVRFNGYGNQTYNALAFLLYDA